MHAATINADEFFQGPFEVIDQATRSIVFLGEDDTRPMGERVRRFLDRYGGETFYVDGRDFAHSQVNLALGNCPSQTEPVQGDDPICVAGGGTGRQPGSSFKPFTLATAFEQARQERERPRLVQFQPQGRALRRTVQRRRTRRPGQTGHGTDRVARSGPQGAAG